MIRISLLVILLAGLLVGCGAPVSSSQSSVGSDPHLDLLVAQAQLTGTAQAFQIQLIGWTATAQAWTATPSLTPVPTSTPTITFTPTVNVTGTIAVEKMNAEIREIHLETERREVTNQIYAASPYIAGFLALFILVMFAILFAKRLSFVPTPIHEATGKPHHMLNVIDAVVSDGDRMTNGMAQLTTGYVKSLPAITPERQDAVTNRAQLVDLHTRRNRLPKRLLETQQSNLPLPAPTENAHDGIDSLFPLPDWNLASSWNKERDALPCGISNKGMEFVNVNQHPHLAIFGMTRSGKSRRGLRPLVAFMLASNQRVVLIGKEVDFLPFIGHPNVVFIPVYDVTERDEAMKYAAALAACVEEKNRRIRYMASRGVSLWEHERTWIVLDELGNAVLEMPSDLGNSTMAKARSLVNEGAKAGMNLVFSAQRPKGFVDLTTQCGRFVFTVETDQERGYALGMKNADRLPEVPVGYFYKKTASLQVTGAFEPSDAEIADYLKGSYTMPLQKADWIEAVVKPTGQGQLSTSNDARSLPEAGMVDGGRLTVGSQPVDEIAELAESIRERWHKGMSKTATSQLLGKPYAGTTWVAKVNKVFDYLISTPTTTQNTAEIGNLGQVTA